MFKFYAKLQLIHNVFLSAISSSYTIAPIKHNKKKYKEN